MTDEKIIELFWSRDERAIKEAEKKYRELCLYVASNILATKEDREECMNDVLLALWNNIPPERPKNLRSYIGTATRNHALNKSKEMNAWKRGGNYQTVGDEFLEGVADGYDLAEAFEAKRAGEVINKFLGTLGDDDRRIFILRFWMGLSIADIARHVKCGESKVKVSIHRSRKKLAGMLEKEGITV